VTESQDLRTFIREQTLRLERIAIAMERNNELIRAEMDRHFDEQAKKLDDLLEENRTQREALFRIFDRLDNGGAAPAG
jgi:hypothetical protein